VRDLGRRYEIREATIKKWCVGSPVQAAIDAVVAILAEAPLDPAGIERIEVELPDDRCALVDGRRMPNINAQHLVALVLVDGRLDFASSHDPARMEDARVMAVRERVRLVPSAELTIAEPPRQAIVRIAMTDGTVRESRTRAVRGTPANPMERAEVVAKALDLVAPVLGRERAERLCRLVANLDGVESVGVALRPLLTP
jgi:2-methylcitrate dehydratase PrpD